MIWSKTRVYADAAAATPLSLAAKQELVRLLDVYGNPGALHLEAVTAKVELERARKKIADSIGAHADEIICTSGGTESNNLAIYGALTRLLKERGSVHAITSSIEHPSVLEVLRTLVSQGLALTELPVNSAGLVSVEDLVAAITKDTVFVSVQFVNSEIGTIQPLRDIARVLRREKKERLQNHNTAPLYLHTDASQAPLWKKIEVEKLGVDLLTLDGQKILGPKGVGVLYVRRGVAVDAVQLGGGQERGLRSGTENLPLVGSFAVAIAEAQSQVSERVKHVADMRNFLLGEICKRVDGVVVNGAVGDVRVVNNLNIAIPGLDGEMAVIALSAEGVATSTRSACDSSDEEPSHVLVAIGATREILKSSIRLTLLPTATKKDVLFIANALTEVAKRYRSVS